MTIYLITGVTDSDSLTGLKSVKLKWQWAGHSYRMNPKKIDKAYLYHLEVGTLVRWYHLNRNLGVYNQTIALTGGH